MLKGNLAVGVGAGSASGRASIPRPRLFNLSRIASSLPKLWFVARSRVLHAAIGRRTGTVEFLTSSDVLSRASTHSLLALGPTRCSTRDLIPHRRTRQLQQSSHRPPIFRATFRSWERSPRCKTTLAQRAKEAIHLLNLYNSSLSIKRHGVIKQIKTRSLRKEQSITGR